MSSKRVLRTLYPAIEPCKTGFLKVSDLHTVYWEQSGAEKGIPVIVLHGGPGGGSQPSYRQFFDPARYTVYQIDQRGAGRSTPVACLEDNTTWALVADIEKVREMLGVEKWHVFGGSWGSTLSLAYAQTHPERVKCLLLRGIFLLRRRELQYFYQKGTSDLFPEEFERYSHTVPEPERGDLIHAFHRRLTGSNEEEKLRCARAWSRWEMATSKLFTSQANLDKVDEDKFALQFARIEAHYFVNGGFFECDGQLLRDMHKIAHIPGVMVQGRYDVVCPAKTAFDVSKKWEKGQLIVVPDAGHSCSEEGIIHELVSATDRFADL